MRKSFFRRTLLAVVALGMSLPMLAAKTKYKAIVGGSCDMCGERIVKAAKSVKGVSKATWDLQTHQFSVEFEGGQAVLSAIQEAILAAGHDIASMRADAAAYRALPECCRYRTEATQATISAEEAAMRLDTVSWAGAKADATPVVADVPQQMAGPMEMEIRVLPSPTTTEARITLSGPTMMATQELRQTQTVEVKERERSAGAHIFQYVGGVKANEQARQDTIVNTKSELVAVNHEDSISIVIDYAQQKVVLSCDAARAQATLPTLPGDDGREPMLLRLVLTPGEAVLKNDDESIDVSISVRQVPAAKVLKLSSKGAATTFDNIYYHRRKVAAQ